MSDENTPLETPPTGRYSRSEFLKMLVVGLGGLMAAAIGLPVVAFILKPIFKAVTPVWRGVGKADSFKVGETVAVTYLHAEPLPWAGVTAKTAAWLRRDSADGFTAFSINCTHLGCPVRWRPDAHLFMCPCHGGVYYQDGTVAAGPPPRPLERYPVRVQDGQVEILVGL
jgi:menaquinol-cytochrome c reductase iron-sulfur subunit